MAGPVGSLLVQIGADADGLVIELGRADKALSKTEDRIESFTKAAARIAAVAVGAGAGLVAMVKSTANTADELGKLSQKTGIAVESLSGLSHAAKLSNVSTEQLNTGLRQLAKHMSENGEAGKDVEQKLLEVADRFKGMRDGAEKTALAMELFGKSGADLIPLLNEGRAGLEAMKDEARRLGLVITAETAKAAQEFNDNLTRLQGALQGVKHSIGSAALPALATFTEQLVEGHRIAGGFFEALRLFGTINPFRSISDNIKELNKDLAALEQGIEKRRARGWDTSTFEGRAADAKKQIEFLKFQQRQEALALAGPGSMDARDLRVHGPKITQPQVPAAEVPSVGTIPNLDFIDKDAEFWAKVHANRLEAEKAAVDQRNLILMEAYDREQEEAIKRAQERLDIEEDAQRQLTDIERRGIKSRADWEKATNAQRTRQIFGDLANITAGVAQHNKTLFNINKAAGIANAIVSAHVGIAKTLETYPYPWSIVMAAAQAAAAFAQVSAIRSAQFSGGGGSAPSIAGSTAAPPVSPVSSGAPGGQGDGGQLTVLHLQGDVFSADGVRKLVEKLNEGRRSGDRIIVR
jgi:hypothetical protein